MPLLEPEGVVDRERQIHERAEGAEQQREGHAPLDLAVGAPAECDEDRAGEPPEVGMAVYQDQDLGQNV